MAKATKPTAKSGKSGLASTSKPGKKALSQETVVESDEESSSEPESDQDSSSESESEDVSSSKASTTANSASEEANGTNASEDSDDDDDSDPSSTEPSSSSEDELDLPVRSSSKPAQIERPLISTEVPRTKFTPSVGYSKIDMYSTSSILDLSSIDSKELWHISVPSGIPITDLTSVSGDGLNSQTTVLTNKGIDYTFAEETQQGSSSVNKSLILPDPTEKTYRSGSLGISKSIRLQPKVTIPKLPSRQTDTATGSNAASETTRLAVTSIRPQPKGLKMRYKPPGFGAGRPGTIGSGSSTADSDTDMDDAPPANRGFQLPKLSSRSVAQTNGTPAKKRKLNEKPATTGAKGKAREKPAPAAPSDDDEEDEAEPEPTPQTGRKLTKAEREEKRARKADRAKRRAEKEALAAAKAG